MAHKIYLKKISRDYDLKPSLFERYVLWSMESTENWLLLFFIGLFMLAITATMFVILGLFVVFEGI